MPEPLGSIKNPEFVPIAELHRRDRLPGYYTIAGTVERAHVYEDDYPCCLEITTPGPRCEIAVEVRTSLMPPRLHWHMLTGAWVIIDGYVTIVRDLRSMVATALKVVHWPAGPDDLLDKYTPAHDHNTDDLEHDQRLGDTMSSVTQQEVDAVVAHCRAELGEHELWVTPEGYPDSLALCVIDAIQSTGSHYTSVVNVINRYRIARGPHDGAKGLLQSITDAGGAQGWVHTISKNSKPASTRPGAPLKAAVIEQAARLLVDLDIDTVEDLVAAVSDSPTDNPVHDGWKKLPSQSSGVTYNYLLLLAGLPSVKPDRMVLRFLDSVAGLETKLTTENAIDLIVSAAAEIGVSPRTLDHVIWRSASGRELTN